MLYRDITEPIYFQDTDCMPVNWLYNRPDNMRRICLSNNVYSILETEHIPDLAASENWDLAVHGVTVTSDKQLKVIIL